MDDHRDQVNAVAANGFVVGRGRMAGAVSTIDSASSTFGLAPRSCLEQASRKDSSAMRRPPEDFK